MAVGLLKEGINEVIATTDGNAAPMGIIFRDGASRLIAFKGSHTAENIMKHGWIVANFIYDPLLYVKTAFEDLGSEWFLEKNAGGTRVCSLAGAEAWIAFEAKIERETSEALIVDLNPLHEQVDALALHPVNRGFNSIIEATVHATRYVRTHDPVMADLILHHSALVRKCGGKREQEALELLLSYAGPLKK
jgi:Uncharacterized conserved protein